MGDPRTFQTVEEELLHPKPLLAKVNLIFGTVMVALTVVSALFVLGLVPVLASIVRAIEANGLRPEALFAVAQIFGVPRTPSFGDALRFVSAVLATALFVSIYLPFWVRAGRLGFDTLGRAFLQWRNSGIPQNVPAHFQAPDEVCRKIAAREKYAGVVKVGEVTKLHGLNAQFMSPLAGELTAATASEQSMVMSRVVRATFWLVLIGGVLWWSGLQSANRLDLVGGLSAIVTTSGFPSLFASVAIPIGASVLFAFAVMVFDYWFVGSMVPRAVWPVETEVVHDKGVATASPVLIAHEFPIRMAKYRVDDEANRVHHLGGEVSSVSLSEAGHFDLHGLIERQPRAIRGPNDTAMVGRLIGGWVFVTLGVATLLFFLMPPAFREALGAGRLPAEDWFLLPIAQIALLTLGRRAISEGRRMIAQAEVLFESQWFSSEAVLFHLRGTTSRAEVKVGRGVADAIETNSTVHRSQFLYEITTTELLTESRTLDGSRSVVGMRNSDASRALGTIAVSELRKIIDEPAKAIQIDMSDPGLQTQVQANVMLDAHRAGQIEAARLQAQETARTRLTGEPKPPTELPPAR